MNEQIEASIACAKCGRGIPIGAAMCPFCGGRQQEPLKPVSNGSWWKRLLAPVLLLLAKGKTLLFFLLKFKFFLSFFAFFGLYWALYGWRFGLGFALSIMVHEFGHYIAVKRLGMKADLPVFLPGFGAFVKWQMVKVSPDGQARTATLKERAEVALAGPLAGLLCSVVFLSIFLSTGQPSWAAVAHAGAWINLLNLIPVWMFDGARATDALNKLHRGLLLATSIVLGIMLGQLGFFFVALGMGYRLFTQDDPENIEQGSTGSNAMMVLFIVILFGLGVMLGLAPARAVR